jgi:hypothetical protein
MPNLEQFKNIAPQTGEIRVFQRTVNGVKKIKAIVVSRTSSNGQDISLSLNELKEIKLPVHTGDVRNLIVEAGSKKSTYYYFNTIDINANTVSDSTNSAVIINPYLPEQFRNNEYNALISNASINRTSKFKFQVDRLEGNTIIADSGIAPVRPTNYNAIISGSADLADVVDSNYTHTGHTNARYGGTETTSEDFSGIDPAIAGKPFEAASYLTGSDDNFICSQSLSDRDLNTFLFTGISDTPVSGSRIFQIEENRVIPLTNRKIWVKDNRNVLTVDNTGFISGSITECSI